MYPSSFLILNNDLAPSHYFLDKSRGREKQERTQSEEREGKIEREEKLRGREKSVCIMLRENRTSRGNG